MLLQRDVDVQNALRAIMPGSELAFGDGDDVRAFTGTCDGVEFAMVRSAYESVGVAPRRLAEMLKSHITATKVRPRISTTNGPQTQ